MNRIIQVPGQPLTTLQNQPQDIEVVFNFLRLVQPDANFTPDFSQAIELREFRLGAELFNYNIPSLQRNSVQPEHNNWEFYLICQGRVRLLGIDANQQREVSIQLLAAGETFGAEYLGGNEPALTRAIAASAGQIAVISSANLKFWLEHLPNLPDYLQQQAKQRQCLAFFKTSTELRSVASHQLLELLPYLAETQVKSGESLLQVAPSSAGRFWLKSGKIECQSGHAPPTKGQSWGYPDATEVDGVAQTDLLVYHLPRENWETAQAIAPVLASKQSDSVKQRVARNGHQRHLTVSEVPFSQSRVSPLPSQQRINSRQAEPESVVFPQPNNSRRGGRGLISGATLNRWRQQLTLPFIEQQSSSDCGAACLAMISQYWGKRFSLNTIRNLAGTDRAGASLKDLAKAAESLGFRAQPVRASLSRLLEQSNPWIAHWQGNHYVVVYRSKGNRLIVADPALHKRSLDRAEFEAGWTGYALLLDPTERLQAAESEKISLSQFWGAILPYRSLIWQIIAASLLIQVCGLITPLFTQIILDKVVVHKSFTTLNIFALGLLLFGIWSIVLSATRQYLLDYFGNRFDLTLVSGFISHTLLLPLKFFESRRVGDIITRVQENQKIQLFLTRQAILTCLDSLMAVVYLGLMFYYNWRLTLLVLALIPPIVLLTLVATPLLRRVSREIFNRAAEQNSLLVEILTGVATVKAAAAERDVRWRWEDRFISALNAQFRGQNLGNALQSTSKLINTLGSTALLWYGATLVIQDQLSIGQFVAFNIMIGNVINPILAAVGLWDQFQEVLISVERLNDVFSESKEESSGEPMLTLPRLRGEVRFENVTFRYGSDQEHNTLQNIEFEVGTGQTIAIVGRSGSGKSTLVKLLQGLYHPNHGRVLVDGHDVRHVSPQSLRIQLGVVPQECFLFSGTILENIMLYRPDFTLEQVIEVAKLAEAHAFIQDLPLGYNTMVGERGTMLSGGQRQRIAIARALLGDPRILVLDEATSSLDTESERRFQQNLSRIARERTTFIIAHRLSTVRNADCILVLDRGILAERGTHTELMTKRGLYYHLAQQQLDL